MTTLRTSQTQRCRECGGTKTRQNIKRTLTVGDRKVRDESVRGLVCKKCGEFVLSHRVVVNAERRAAIVVLREASTISGAVFKYARKALGVTQVELAGLLGVASETISRWETGSLRVERSTQLALAELLVMSTTDPGGLKQLGEQPAARSGTG